VWKTPRTTKGKQKRVLEFAIGFGFLNAFLDPAEVGIGLHRYSSAWPNSWGQAFSKPEFAGKMNRGQAGNS
jgi:hypothetical protein